ncbi:MAG TPA: hypothetical protein VIW02_04920 [Gammaproteobacteria bacterium]
MTKLDQIKRDPSLSTMFSVVLATFILFNSLFIYLFIGPLAATGLDIPLALLITVVEAVALVLILRSIRVEGAQSSDDRSGHGTHSTALQPPSG